ncbi:MAG: hypothetical protein JWL77_222 [Chthonomonadaceae bacterium]|nr:hypothetical protein [Chthonomonadaceae bacterium]
MKRQLRTDFTVLPLFLLLCGVSGSLVQAQPLAPPTSAASDVPTKADPAAYELLKNAHDRRSNLPKDFGGFTADVMLNDNGVETPGTVTYTTGKGLDMQVAKADKDAQKWLSSALLSAVAHRMAGDFSKGDGSHPLTFTPDDHSPLGRQIALNDVMKSFYRVRDNQIIEVTRTAGDSRFTITMLENTIVDGDKYLPKHFVVTYFNATTGVIEHTEYFTDTHTRIGGAWMPTGRRVVTAANGAFTTRSYELKNLRLLPSLPTTQASR